MNSYVSKARKQITTPFTKQATLPEARLLSYQKWNVLRTYPYRFHLNKSDDILVTFLICLSKNRKPKIKIKSRADRAFSVVAPKL